ncbi:glycosyltransferase family 4 protein [Halobium salinum]|uniref:Glycosyltransferase family 4 protein n=1 Tax=Halobium salinum TaxID=1364940 RepID=A0ABD5PAE7_9EURY|nr:glycosyltransferase family 4 protein [Halobium salinum]
MRILIVNDYFEQVGGVEVYVHRVKDLLRERGHEVAVVGGKETNSVVAGYVRSLYSFRYQRRIMDAVDQFDPDLVFCHSVIYNISPSFLRPLHRRGVPVVLTVHELNGLSFRRYPNLPPAFVLPSLLRKLLHRPLIERYVDAFVAPSSIARHQLETEVGVDNVSVIRNPVFWEVASEPPSFGSGRVLYIGRLDRKKGVHVLVAAFADLVLRMGTGTAPTLEIVGTGEELSVLRSLVSQHSIEEHVTFTGHLDHEAVRGRYRDADVFVLPSIIEENCPLTVMEAMCQGVPVVTTDFGGQRELVAGHGCARLVPPGDADALGQTLYDLLDDVSTLTEMGRNAVDAAADFSKERHATQLESLFQGLVSDRRVTCQPVRSE